MDLAGDGGLIDSEEGEEMTMESESSRRMLYRRLGKYVSYYSIIEMDSNFLKLNDAWLKLKERERAKTRRCCDNEAKIPMTTIDQGPRGVEEVIGKIAYVINLHMVDS
nr:hypothetical protein Iba_chr02bCG15700 [Ipomoea batatas]